jgi:hypothetical protein
MIGTRLNGHRSGRRIQTFSTCEYSSSTGVARPKIDTAT